MKTIRLLAVVVMSFSVCMLIGCSRSKSVNSSQYGTQTMGIGEDGGFADEDSPNRLKAPYNQTYHFDLNEYNIHQEDVASVNVQADYLLSHPKAKVRLEGNCDERGSREYNIALGWKRAKAVAAVLKQQGVSDAQIVMISYGKEKPVALGYDENAHRLNRRTDLIYEVK